MPDPAFLGSLSPPDFAGAGRRGWFVYAYLRSKDGFGRKGSPYYIGIASRANRPFDRHSCPVPSNRAFVRILRSSLTRQQANAWEQLYIARYGRKDLGTGTLLNKTDGGDGSPGHIMPPDVVKRIAAIHRGKVNSPETRARMSAAHQGKIISPEQREKIRQANLGKKQSPETIEKRAAARRGTKMPQAQRTRISSALRGYIKPEESKRKQSETRIRNFASKAGMTVDEYMQTPGFIARQKQNARRRQRAANSLTH
jgi:hypothetical protein